MTDCCACKEYLGTVEGLTNHLADFWHVGHSPLQIDTYDAGTQFDMSVQFTWNGQAHQDYTVKVYSAHSGVDLYDEDGNTNMLHNDGSSPSEFDLADTMSNYIIEESTSPSTTPVSSLADVFDKAESAGEIFAYIWNNPWTLFVWFDWPF